MTNTLTESAPGKSFEIAPGPLRGTTQGLAKVLREHRHELATLLMGNVADWEKFASLIPQDPRSLREHVELEHYTFVNLLALLFESGDDSFKDIYIGHKILQLYWPGFQSPSEREALVARVLEADERVLCDFLEGKVGADDLARLKGALGAINRVLLARGKKTLEVLLVGDCVFVDVFSFLTGQCLDDEISINPTYATSKNPVELRKELRGLADRKFDLVFYSPFTFQFSFEFAETSLMRNSLRKASEVRGLAEGAFAQVEPTLDVLSALFECPIFVHNASNVRRTDGSLGERAKNLATRRTRWMAKRLVNARLSEYIARRNLETFKHLHIIDEDALLAGASETELGRFLYKSFNHHATVMGRRLASVYRDLIASHVHLLTKKLVVCDLDNTIWEGEIGEGQVRHFTDRQETLKTLREKGVVLSVNSKNDPKNVHWKGSVLGEDDFVCMQINWDSKVVNMKRIQENLNLKYKDYVFIDDRADQRQMVGEAIPEIRVMDATSERTWTLLRLWSEMLEDQAETDRTQLYRERDLRENFVAATEAVESDPTALFAKLEIKVTIREARTPDLKRVAELINRTNQFNMQGSRTTFREVSEWHAMPGTHILIVEGADKFGQMGQICALVLEAGESQVRIPVFVLSCRVFGYGIETALINAIKRRFGVGTDGQGVPIVGLYQETASNEPCRKVYPENGFALDGSAWVYQGLEEPVDPAWLTIQLDWENRVKP
jgi:FkbH-like protein